MTETNSLEEEKVICQEKATQLTFTLSSEDYKLLERTPLQDNHITVDRRRVHRMKRLFRDEFSHEKRKDVRRLRILANNDSVDDMKRFLDSCPYIKLIINSYDSKRRTALHFSAARGSDEIVHVLLNHGADPNLKDFNGNCPLHLAACTHHIRVITLLLKFGADVKACDSFGKTPLHLSLSRLRVLKNCDNYDSSSYSALKLKAEVGEIVSMLTEYLEKSGQDYGKQTLSRISTILCKVKTREEVDEVGSLLTNFTQMTIDASAKSKMAEE